MKTIATTLIATTLAIGAVSQAEARPDHDRYYDDHRPRHVHRHYHYAPPPPPPRVRHRHYDWIAPAAVVTLGAIAIGAAINNAPPPPAYAPPPPPPGNWYYCRSSGQYYPYTDACPDGWMVVPAR